MTGFLKNVLLNAWELVVMIAAGLGFLIIFCYSMVGWLVTILYIVNPGRNWGYALLMVTLWILSVAFMMSIQQSGIRRRG